MNKLISIIMPVYNAEAYIKTAIDSVLEQSFENWELLIINDGSTDNTGKVLNEYTDPRIKTYQQENKGVSAARNIGLTYMKGDYFCFLDADDYFPPESLESRANILMNDPEVEFVDGSVLIWDKDLNKILKKWEPVYKGNPVDQLLALSDWCFFGPTWMIRRDRDRSYQFHTNLTHGEDLLFFIELSLNGSKYDFVDDVILHYRKGHLSAMKNLKGLEKGYRYIFKIINGNKNIPHKKALLFEKKAKSIIFKSYIGNFHFLNGLKSLIIKW